MENLCNEENDVDVDNVISRRVSSILNGGLAVLFEERPVNVRSYLAAYFTCETPTALPAYFRHHPPSAPPANTTPTFWSPHSGFEATQSAGSDKEETDPGLRDYIERTGLRGLVDTAARLVIEEKPATDAAVRALLRDHFQLNYYTIRETFDPPIGKLVASTRYLDPETKRWSDVSFLHLGLDSDCLASLAKEKTAKTKEFLKGTLQKRGQLAKENVVIDVLPHKPLLPVKTAEEITVEWVESALRQSGYANVRVKPKRFSVVETNASPGKTGSPRAASRTSSLMGGSPARYRSSLDIAFHRRTNSFMYPTVNQVLGGRPSSGSLSQKSEGSPEGSPSARQGSVPTAAQGPRLPSLQQEMLSLLGSPILSTPGTPESNLNVTLNFHPIGDQGAQSTCYQITLEADEEHKTDKTRDGKEEKDATEVKKRYFILKVCGSNIGWSGDAAVAAREMAFYKDVVPLLAGVINVPRMYWCGCASDWGNLLMEDVTSNGTEATRSSDITDWELVYTALAKMHAVFMKLPAEAMPRWFPNYELEPDILTLAGCRVPHAVWLFGPFAGAPSWQGPLTHERIGTYREGLTRLVRWGMVDPMALRYFDQLFENLPKYCEQVSTMRTVCRGDCHLWNAFIRNEELVFYDFAEWCTCHPVADVAYAWYSTWLADKEPLPTDTVLPHYISEFEQTLGVTVDEGQFMFDFQVATIFAIVLNLQYITPQWRELWLTEEPTVEDLVAKAVDITDSFAVFTITDFESKYGVDMSPTPSASPGGSTDNDSEEVSSPARRRLQRRATEQDLYKVLVSTKGPQKVSFVETESRYFYKFGSIQETTLSSVRYGGIGILMPPNTGGNASQANTATMCEVIIVLAEDVPTVFPPQCEAFENPPSPTSSNGHNTTIPQMPQISKVLTIFSPLHWERREVDGSVTTFSEGVETGLNEATLQRRDAVTIEGVEYDLTDDTLRSVPCSVLDSFEANYVKPGVEMPDADVLERPLRFYTDLVNVCALPILERTEGTRKAKVAPTRRRTEHAEYRRSLSPIPPPKVEV